MSSTHANPLGVKTDCPPEVLWDLIRGWVETHPVTRKLELDSAAAKILARPAAVKANFTRVLGAISASKQAKQARFLPNPEPNWGPRPKHGRPVRVRPTLCSLAGRLQLGWAAAVLVAVGAA